MKDFLEFCSVTLILLTIHSHANPLEGGISVVPAQDNEFPFIVSFADSPATHATDHFCGGTLISKKHILTARHCLVDANDRRLKNITEILITIGSNDMTRGRKYNIASWKTYERWALENNMITENLNHDLVIVTLSEDVNHIAPVSISQCKHKQVRGCDVVTAGWGVSDGGVEPKFLQKATLKVISRKKCRTNFFRTDLEPSYMILNHLCTVSRPPVILGCGDSGSPLLINGNQLIGVNSFVCANDIQHPNEQNVHQSVQYYRQFIEAFAENVVACPFRLSSENL